MIEQATSGEYIIGETGCDLSRNKVTVSGGVLAPGQVLGLHTARQEYRPLTPGTTDGLQVARVINYSHIDATTAVDAVVTESLTAVRDEDLIWPDGISESEKATAISELALAFIKVKGA